MSAEREWLEGLDERTEYERWSEVCEECGSDDPEGGFVNFGCVIEDCPGCDRCDLPCLTCGDGRVR